LSVNQEELSILLQYSDPLHFGQIGILSDRLDLQYHLSTCLSYDQRPDIPAMVLLLAALARMAHWGSAGYTEMIEVVGDTVEQGLVVGTAEMIGDIAGAIALVALGTDTVDLESAASTADLGLVGGMAGFEVDVDIAD